MTEPFPLIEVSGPPHERGRQYGRQAATRIRKGIAHYTAQLARLSLDRAGIASLVRSYTPVIESFDPTHLEEMRGIAAGADVDLPDIVLLNARTEILKLAEQPQLRAALAEAEGCTARRGDARGNRVQPPDPRPELGLEGRVRRNRDRPAHPLRRRTGHPDLHRGRRPRAFRHEQRRHRHHRELPAIRPRLSAHRRAPRADPPQSPPAAVPGAGNAGSARDAENPPPTT